jgi:hypothetical protein
MMRTRSVAAARLICRSRFGRTLIAIGIVVASALGAFAASTPAAPAPNASRLRPRLGQSRFLQRDYFGINYDYVQAALVAADRSATDRRLAALEPGTVRWPGGTEADNFQWRLGYPVKPPIVVASPCKGSSTPGSGEVRGFRFTLEDLRAAYRASGAIPMFDLNMLDSTLNDQLAMLRAARRLGLPVRYVELGNELYFCNNEWVHYFPTAAAYGRAVAHYVRALHRQFPGVRVAAIGSAPSDIPRERTWNREMLEAALRAGALPDAITLHKYPGYNAALTASGLPALFSEAYASVTQLDSVIAKLPVPEPAWITEYNLEPKHPNSPNPAQDTYAHALFAAEMALLMPRVRDSHRVDFWAAFGPGPGYAYDAGTGSGDGTVLSPSGLAIQWIDQAARCATSTAPIRFDDAPRLVPGGRSAVLGQLFGSDGGRRAVLINLSGEAIKIRAGAVMPIGAPYAQMTGNPVAPTGAASQLATSDGVVTDTTVLAPYSITRIGGSAAQRC